MPHHKRTFLLALPFVGTLWFAQILFAQSQTLPQIPLPQIPQNQAGSLTYTLTRTAPGQLGQSLRQICLQRFTVESQNQYVITTEKKGVRRQCSLRVEPSSNQIQFSGDKQLCDQVFLLLTAIDQPTLAGKGRQIVTYQPHVLPEVLTQALESCRTPAPKPFGDTAVRRINPNPRPIPNPILQADYQIQGDGMFNGGTDSATPLPGMQGGVIPPELMPPGIPPAIGLTDEFKYQLIPELDVIVIDADGPRLERFTDMIRQIEEISKLRQPKVEMVYLKHINNVTLGNLFNENNSLIIQAVFGTVPGRVQFIPMVTPNAMLLIGWGDAMDTAKEFLATFDKPHATEGSRFQIFKLKHISVAHAQTTLQGAPPRVGPFPTNIPPRSGLWERIDMYSDTRTNTLIVYAAPNDLEEFTRILEMIDVADSSNTLQMKTRQLKNTLASDLEPTLTSAMRSGTSDGRVPNFELLIQSEQGQQIIKSGILSDAAITTDVRNNTLIIKAPESCMPFIDELISALDVSAPEAEIKVFDIEFANAKSLVAMLRQLIPSNIEGTPGPRLPASAGEEEALIPIRLASDDRTNSIVAAGSKKDLEIVEALVNRLDQENFQARKLIVYPLKNMKAIAYETDDNGRAIAGEVGGVAATVNKYITDRLTIQKASPDVISPYEQLESAVIVIPDAQTNSLIISATDRYLEEILKLVEEIDKSPPQVVIQVLIAEVTLSENKEWAAELGFQDPLLFLRGKSGPGLNFNNLDRPLGSDPVNTGTVGTQLLSNFGAGRGTGGGMVFSASSEYLNVMLQALHEKRRLEVLSKPQITAMNNQRAVVSVGQRVPMFYGLKESGYNNASQPDVKYEEVELQLLVTPSISPEGTIVMTVIIKKDKIGAAMTIAKESYSTIDTANIATMISAANDETVVLGGLITKDENKIRRKVPLLGDIPFLGKLWRQESTKTERKELLVILTPRIVKSPDDMAQIKQMETARMSWCLSNVVDIYNDIGAYNVVSDRPYTGNAPVITPGPVKPDTLQPMESQFIAPTLPKRN
ncbi:MAG: hypothetical protein LBI05_04060 [Planctomycetaceae bacterium]|nr:hypothetical protein [Planctomycetaceae bacterium]